MRRHYSNTSPHGMVPDKAEHWSVRAACRDGDPELFTPVSFAHDVEIEAALEFCRRCQVRTQCLADGHDDRWSIRGGLTAGERWSSRKRQASEVTT